MAKTCKNNRSFKEIIAGYFAGRNGFDSICGAAMLTYLVLALINLFAGSVLLWFVNALLIIYVWFRVLSKNVYSRQKESSIFNSKLSGLRTACKRRVRMWKERKDYVFKKCPYCKNILRLKRVKGKHSVRCPCCNGCFSINI